jgi:phenylacetate-CoA ligase
MVRISIFTLKRLLRELELRLRSKGQRFANKRRLAEWQWLPGHEVEALQKQRLRALVSHAAAHVAYYRRTLREAGVVDARGRIDLGPWSDVPLLDKTVLREQFEDLKSESLDRRTWKLNTSGGSTGEPARFIQDHAYREWNEGTARLFGAWTGHQEGTPRVVLWGSLRDLLVGRETPRVRLGRWLEGAAWLNAYGMDGERMKLFVEQINRTRPSLIHAYVESIYELAAFIDAEGLDVHSPDSVMTAAGTLHPWMRDVIERVFRAPVFNNYGLREVGGVASECDRHEGLHISPLTHYVEILRPDGLPTEVGEVGEVVLTSLTNYAMPLIRYQVGDMAAWAENSCSCGRSWPLLKEVTGRSTDVFVRKDGSKVYPQYFTQVMVEIPSGWVRKFQVVQEHYDHVRIRLVADAGCPDPREQYADSLNEISEKIRAAMGQRCRVDYDFVNDIEPTSSGKYRYVLSKVMHR